MRDTVHDPAEVILNSCPDFDKVSSSLHETFGAAAIDLLGRQYHGSSERLQRPARLFNKHGDDYIIAGAFALGFHGARRYTGDLDIFVKPDPLNTKWVNSYAGNLTLLWNHHRYVLG